MSTKEKRAGLPAFDRSLPMGVFYQVGKYSKSDRNLELELIWKAKIVNDESGVFEDNIQHARSCICCTPLSVCEEIDEERERKHNTKSKIRRLRVDRRILVPKVGVPIEQNSELLTMQLPEEGFFSV